MKDCPEWCADIGLAKVPDHNTLCRAHRQPVKPGVVEKMLDVSVATAGGRGGSGGIKKSRALRKRDRKARRKERTAALDSTMFEPHQVSRYFDKRRKYSDCQAKAQKHRPRNANSLRASTNKRMPKLSLAVQASSHLILAACPSIGMGSDHSPFNALLHGPAVVCRWN